MPRINLYVKQEDWEAFQAITDKPAWLHNAIQGLNYVSILTPEDKSTEDVSILTPEDKSTEDVSILTPEDKSTEDVSILTPVQPNIEDIEDDDAVPEDELIPDPNNKNRAWDPDIEEYVKVKYVKGKMVRV